MFSEIQEVIVPKENTSLLYKIKIWWWDSWFYEVYQYSWLYNLRWYLTHWWRKDHWVKTNLPIGYSDNVALMEDALFSLVEQYISRDCEDAFSRVNYDGAKIDIKEKIIKILHFYNVRKPELESKYEDLLNECYGDVVMNFIDVGNPHGKLLDMKYMGPMKKEERDKKIQELNSLEYQIYQETQVMLKKCIDVRSYLWT